MSGQLTDGPKGCPPHLLHFKVGSAAIYGSGKDVDYVVLAEACCDYINAAVDDGWALDGNYKGEEFTALRKGAVNIILTEHRWLFQAYVQATGIMQTLSSVVPQKNKAGRVEVYELVKRFYKEAHYEQPVR